MGRMNRYEGNIMTWVKASNGKLIDRTLRYIEQLAKERGLKSIPREELTRILFAAIEQPKIDQPAMVLRVLKQLKAR
jgi:N-acetylmuramic acid 6-phosphate etherase